MNTKFVLNERFIKFQTKLVSCGISDLSEIEQQDYYRMIRDSMLADTDFTRLDDAPISDTERENYKLYRGYLRDYPSKPNWWKSRPFTFEEFLNSKNS